MLKDNEIKALCEDVLGRAAKAGTTHAEVVYRDGRHLSAKVRMRAPELIEEAGSRSLGLRVLRGQRTAAATTSDLSEAGLARIVADATELLAVSEEDRFAGPPDAKLLATQWDDSALELSDAAVASLSGERCLARATASESAALDSDARVSNSEGATFVRVRGAAALATSRGFFSLQRGTFASSSVMPVAEEESGKKRAAGYWDAARHLSDLAADQAVGSEAGRRALAKLGARRVKTQQAPVIFEREAARSILGLLAGCVSGASVWRKQTYLAERLGTEVANACITLVDNPLIPRAMGSRAVDGEGLPSQENVLVENGRLQSFLTDTYAARRLGHARSTASASRGAAGVGVGITNLCLAPGKGDLDSLIAATPRGLIVTDMMGFGFNAVTGDFSRGASGFWVEKGVIQHPVSEVTISLNLDDLLKRIDALAGDVDTRAAIRTPSFRVAEMTIAGA